MYAGGTKGGVAVSPEGRTSKLMLADGLLPRTIRESFIGNDLQTGRQIRGG